MDKLNKKRIIDFTYVDFDVEKVNLKEIVEYNEVILINDERDNKVIVDLKNSKDEEITLIYKKLDIKNINSMIEKDGNLDISFSFIDELVELNYFKLEKFPINNLNAICTFFNNDVSFFNCKLQGELVNFEFAKFNGNITFKQVEFDIKSQICFDNTNIGLKNHESAISTKAIFSSLTFEKANLYFRNSLFLSDTSFKGSEFIDSAIYLSFSKFYCENLDLSSCKFGGFLNLGHSKFLNTKIDLSYSKILRNFAVNHIFAIGIDLISKNLTINSEDLNIISFEQSKIIYSKLYFEKAQIINSKINMNFLNIINSELNCINCIFEKIELESFSRLNVSCSELNFTSCKFIETPIIFHMGRITMSKIIFQMVELEKSDISFNSMNFNKTEISIMHTNFETSTIYNVNSDFDILKIYNCKIEQDMSFHFKSINQLNIENCNIKSDFSLENDSFNVPFVYKNISFDETKCSGAIFLNLKKNKIINAINSQADISFEKTNDDELTLRKYMENHSENKGFWGLVCNFIAFMDRYRTNPMSKFLLIFLLYVVKIKKSKIINQIKNEYKMKQYRLLKQNFNNLGYYEDEDLALRKYMQHYFKGKGFIGYPLRFFGFMGGYGTKPARVLISSFFCIIFFSLFYFVSSINFQIENYDTKNIEVVTSENSYEYNLVVSDIDQIQITKLDRAVDAVYFSGITFLTVGYGDYSAKDASTYVKFLTIAEGFVGISMMGYFTVSLFRKIVR